MPKFIKGNRAFVGAKGQGKSTLPTGLPEKYGKGGLLDGMDKRSRPAKVLGRITNAIYSDLGGKDNVSVMQQIICEKIAYLTLMTAKTELILIQGGHIDEAAYLNSINCLSGLLSKIGLKRRSKQISLRDYLTSKPEPVTAPSPAPLSEPSNKKEN